MNDSRSRDEARDRPTRLTKQAADAAIRGKALQAASKLAQASADKLTAVPIKRARKS
jgi:hypothetical protein